MSPATLEKTTPVFAPREMIPLKTYPNRERNIRLSDSDGITRTRIGTRPSGLDRPSSPGSVITDRDELGRRITTAAMSGQPANFAVACRSTMVATSFATPFRSLLLALSSGFQGISITVSPNLLLHTYPAMESLVRHLESTGCQVPWQPVGERSVGLGSAKHMFVSYDTPVREHPRPSRPNLLLEIVGAHLIPAGWFDAIVAPKCDFNRLAVVCYGMVGVKGSLFERAWNDNGTRGLLGTTG